MSAIDALAACLPIQHECMVCGVLLAAYSQIDSVGRWVCPDHRTHELDVHGPARVTCATKYDKRKHN